MKPTRQIIHCDADCFYASVEMRDDPSLRGRPLAIGGEADRRGVVATCNYEARKFGVRSAMSMAYARRLCPGLIVRRPDMEKYRQLSLQIRDIFERYTQLVEPLSLDEAFLDVTEHPYLDAMAIAAQIRQQVAMELGITISAGVAPNKFLAKIASDWEKPDGLTQIAPEQVAEFVARLPVQKIFGVGKVTGQKLQAMGVLYCADLLPYSLEQLEYRFGRFGKQLYQLCRGIDERPVQPSRRRKSLSVEQTYAQDLPDLDACLDELPLLLQKLEKRLEPLLGSYQLHKPFVKVKFSDFSSTTVEKNGADYSQQSFAELMAEAFGRAFKPVRLLGVGVRFR
ncbi:MAG: DNA polymerase IV, partial [Cellvibrionaceae bacterium]|nr:DNA polymerase IV [Cellvibrionaceae bacterium]